MNHSAISTAISEIGGPPKANLDPSQFDQIPVFRKGRKPKSDEGGTGSMEKKKSVQPESVPPDLQVMVVLTKEEYTRLRFLEQARGANRADILKEVIASGIETVYKHNQSEIESYVERKQAEINEFQSNLKALQKMTKGS